MIPVLYELGRELYDRRTGLIAAAFAAVSPLLIWYSQEVRMYEFAALFGLLALLTQLRVIRNGDDAQLGGVHPRHRRAAVVALLRPAPDRRAAARLRRRAHPPQPQRAAGQAAGARLRLLARRARDAARAARSCSPTTSTRSRPARPARRAGPTTTCRSTPCSSNMAWSLWGYQPDATTVLLAAMWPLFLLGSLVLLGRGGSRQTMSLAAAAIALVALLIVVSVFDRSLLRGPQLPDPRAARAAADRAARSPAGSASRGRGCSSPARSPRRCSSAWPISS